MRVNYQHPTKMARKDKKKKRLQRAREEQKQDKKVEVDKDMDAENDDNRDKLVEKGLTVAKRKQIFKKHKAKDVKAQIAELMQQSKKLKKKDLDQKAQKRKIAKQIKELKASIKRCGESQDGSDSDQ